MGQRKIIYKISWVIFAFLGIAIGLYPLIYFMADREFGLLSSKTVELLSDIYWNVGFYGHITFGGIALLSGWSQFNRKLRNKRLNLHRNLGKLYLISVTISGICGVFIGYYATGGWISQSGFILLGLLWFASTFMAYRTILNKEVSKHENWMIISYALCFAAVTLRIWLPILSAIFIEFVTAYRIVSWLCWVPNLLFALYLIRKKRLIADHTNT